MKICSKCRKEKEYRKNNPDKIRAWRKKHNSETSTKISCNLRSRLRIAIKNNYKYGSAVRDLGCSIEEFKIYIEQKFYNNKETDELMTLENYGLFG